ncbi:MAG TPA: sulfatase-like hydrolase/transferase [Kofleriaceae bacterium]|nr:sulfatase-like hydrolase/transferase [Kofleriaceae bacterium]
MFIRPDVRLRDRFALALLAMLCAAVLSECVRIWPGQSAGPGFVLLLLAQIAVLSGAWVLLVALAVLAAAAVVRALAARRAAAEGAASDDVPARQGGWRWLVWLPPAAFAQVTAGTALLEWSQGAFVRQDLAAGVMPVALLVVFAVMAAGAYAAHRLLGERIQRLPGWSVAATTAAGALAASVAHLARFPQVLEDPLVPSLIQLVAVAALGSILFAAAPPMRRRLGQGYLLAGLAGLWLILLIVLAFGGRLAPASYPVVAAAVDGRGLMAARIAPILGRLGDGDGDGFGRYFGGLDCDDGDPGVHPLAKDVPGDGIDQDCFEGDLSSEAIARARAGRQARRRPPRQRVRNVILITVDALRADAVGFGGARRPSSPSLDRLAARSTVFESAWSHAPMTRRAFPALLAGRYPSNIHWLDLETSYPYPVSHQDNLYLAELVRDAGIRTAMAVPFGYAVNSRFDQGFEQKQVRPASKYKDEINAHVVVEDAISFLDRWAAEPSAPRFFLWIHFYEAHFPYVRHARYGFGDSPFERYLSEVRYIDDQIARLLARLEDLRLAGDTAIVFTADHGEEFGEHGGEAHGDLYPEDLRVPLLIHVPGGAARRVERPARLIDVAPTVAELLGLEVPDSFDGDSLVAVLEGEPMQPRPVFAELIPDRKVPRRVVSLTSGGWQLIADFGLGARQLFDLRRDPTAQENLLIDAPGRAQALEAELRRHLALWIGPLRLTRASEEGGR